MQLNEVQAFEFVFILACL